MKYYKICVSFIWQVQRDYSLFHHGNKLKKNSPELGSEDGECSSAEAYTAKCFTVFKLYIALLQSTRRQILLQINLGIVKCT